MRMGIPACRIGIVAFALLVQGAWVAEAAFPQDGIPDFSGSWQSAHNRKFIAPASGPGPVMDDPAHPHRGRGVDVNGRDTGTTPWVGDYRNSNLHPWVAAAVKKAGEDNMAGKGHPTAESTCYPAGVPNILNFFEPVYFLQTKDEVAILYQRGPNIRHVYLNVPHSQEVKPSWYGESVGHYEGDTLIVDTIGLNDKTVLDSFMTPHSSALHIVERYRVDPDGKTMRVDFRVEDPNAFNVPWSASGRYRRINQSHLEESICAENNTDQFTGKMFPIPVAGKSDF